VPHTGSRCGRDGPAVDYASICATDLRILRGVHRKYGPGTVRVPGHEVVGTIAELGRGVGAPYRAGQRVFVAPNVGAADARSASVDTTTCVRLTKRWALRWTAPFASSCGARGVSRAG